jgi:8-oxo-dGTP diphosphatase
MGQMVMENVSVCIILLNSSRQVLLTSRRNDITQWCLPGGKVEKDESLEVAAGRELFEETGYAASFGSLCALHVGKCGDNIVCSFIVDTYAEGLDKEIAAEVDEITVKWGTLDYICDPANSPFHVYNTDLKQTFDVVMKGIWDEDNK